MFCHVAEARNTATRNYRLNLIRKLFANGSAPEYEIDSVFHLEQEAFERECLLIRSIGRHDLGTGPLSNMTDGGEGLVNPGQETQDKQRACWSGIEGDSDYALINRYTMQFLPGSEAIPIKPLGKLRLQPLSPHPQPRKVSKRQCAALLASIVATRNLLVVGCEVSRRFRHQETDFVIENGVGRDILRSNLATLSDQSRECDELFIITRLGYEAIIKYFGRSYLESIGILEPL